ncbi:MAG: flippase-like domain-containing protein [Verrucomicrobia bacterium]|jgi:glycosyltransferase 2 family protein|nr:flippase-like domain-containing protein [Verrucomicrobiota bacterium]MBT7067305.1 flippase-like domain-containing protein [Verrucomicrobiota bacterium]
MKKRLISLLQLALGIGLVSFLFFRMDNKADLLHALRSIARNWPCFAGAVICFLACILVCTRRWLLILRAHDIQVSFWHALELYFIGQFFNAFMFGSIGGDLVKVFFVAKSVPDKRAEAVTTVFIDRFMGMLALVALIGVILACRFNFFTRYAETRLVMLFMFGVLFATVLGLVVVFRKNVFEHSAFFRRMEDKYPIGRTISKVYGAFHACLTHHGLLGKLLALSVANHVIIIVAALLLGLGLNIRTIPAQVPPPVPEGIPAEAPAEAFPPFQPFAEFANYLTVFPIVNGIAAIPATPGSLGTREYATKFLLGVPEFQVPETRSVPLSLLLYVMTLFWSLVGGLVYLRYTLHAGKPTKSDLEALV